MMGATISYPQELFETDGPMTSIIVPKGNSSARLRERAATTSGLEYAPEAVSRGLLSVCSGTALYAVRVTA